MKKCFIRCDEQTIKRGMCECQNNIKDFLEYKSKVKIVIPCIECKKEFLARDLFQTHCKECKS